MKKLYLLLITLIELSSVGYAQFFAGNTAVYIILHGKKDISDPEKPGPQLSTGGQGWAKSLASLVTGNYGKPHHSSIITQ